MCSTLEFDADHFSPDMSKATRNNRINHELGDHNNRGAKETLMIQTESGDMIGVDGPSKKKTPPPTVTPENKKKRKKMMPRVSREKATQPMDAETSFFTESLGPNGDFLLFTGNIHRKRDPFLWPICEAIKDPSQKGGEVLVDAAKLDCRLANPKFLSLRKSPQENEKIPFKSPKGLFQMAVVAYPNKNNYTKELKKDPFHLEKMFFDECQKILARYDGKTNQLNQWTKANTFTVQGKYRPLDHVLMDETVGHILSVYFVDNETGNTREIYETLEEYETQDMFFSKNPKTDAYSDIAVAEYGYPRSS